MNSSGRTEGSITISCNACLATSWPAISVHSTLAPPSTISSRMSCTSFCSTPLTLTTGVLAPLPPLPLGALLLMGVRERSGGVLRPEDCKAEIDGIWEWVRSSCGCDTYELSSHRWWCSCCLARLTLQCGAHRCWGCLRAEITRQSLWFVGNGQITRTLVANRKFASRGCIKNRRFTLRNLHLLAKLIANSIIKTNRNENKIKSHAVPGMEMRAGEKEREENVDCSIAVDLVAVARACWHGVQSENLLRVTYPLARRLSLWCSCSCWA